MTAGARASWSHKVGPGKLPRVAKVALDFIPKHLRVARLSPTRTLPFLTTARALLPSFCHNCHFTVNAPHVTFAVEA
jgi:hypothetical protein